MSTLNPEPSPFENVYIFDNTSQVLIRVTEDKLINYLREYNEKILIRRSWVAPLGILLTLIIAMVTSNFIAAFGISASVWKDIFKLGIWICSIWLLINIFRSIKNHRDCNINQLIEKIKTG